MQTKHYVVLALVVGLAVGIGGWLLFVPKTSSAPTTSTTASTTTIDLGNGNIVQVTGSSTITEVDTPVAPSIKPPAVVALSFSADLPADAKAALQSQFNTYTAELKTAPTRTDLWLSLGIVYKIAGQYSAAVTAWTYVAKAGGSSVNYVAYGNLGDLYLNFTHEYAKAAAAYKAALALQPGNADFTAGLKAALAAEGK